MKALLFTAFSLTVWVSYKQNEMETYTYIVLSTVSVHSNQHNVLKCLSPFTRLLILVNIGPIQETEPEVGMGAIL